MHVRRQVLIVGGKVSVGPPKGKEQGGKERDVPLSGEIGLRLAAHLAEFPPVPVGLPRQGSGREAADSEPAVQQVRRQGDQSPQLELRCLEARAASVAAGVMRGSTNSATTTRAIDAALRSDVTATARKTGNQRNSQMFELRVTGTTPAGGRPRARYLGATMKTLITPTADARPGDLETLEDSELLRLIRSAPRGSYLRDAACEVLVTRYRPLVRSCVLRYRNSTEPQEELMQVGYVGLLKAINNFDPAVGASLASYAQPCVSGEIKRHFRDKRWQVHVQRSLQELRLELRNVTSELTNSRGRTPTDAELAQHMDIPEENVREARQADMAFQAASLDSPLAGDDGTASLAELLGEDDPQLQHVIDMQAVWAHWGDLAEREQQLLLMRFYGNMTQSEIGERLGVSQMHVSRLLAEALRLLRNRLVEPAASCAY